MKLFRQLALLSLLTAASSCAFFNSKTVDVSFGSNPAGANIFIEGRNYGQTPATINIEPKEYNVTLVKEGYGSANLKTEIWYGTVRTDVNGNRTGDGTRCILDMLTVLFSFNSWNSTRCGDFKQKQYFVTIPHFGNTGASNGSMIGVGQRPADMINYYYNQDNAAQGAYQGSSQRPANGGQQGNNSGSFMDEGSIPGMQQNQYPR